ncbi:hypothetical protein [Shewanella salipaludis]|uniref:Uncharacterized protein n=1 Tax=Shewanella salipaludis TaxID=2723052 RepID=A0A972JIV1_9GAMM|nr:hypothetical protein [Shewanella salipaludis]NMH65468.1 hypothetical protein [Shewanella salipaludis]
MTIGTGIFLVPDVGKGFTTAKALTFDELMRRYYWPLSSHTGTRIDSVEILCDELALLR